MRNKTTIYKKLLEEYDRTREKNSIKQAQRYEEVYEKIPMIEEIDKKINEIGLNAAKDTLRGKIVDISSQIEELKIAKLGQLINNGYPKDYLELEYQCRLCKDTGFIGSEECSCFSQKLAKEYYKMSNLDKVLERENFSTFDYNVFSEEIDSVEGISPKENMINMVDVAEEYVKYFEDPDIYNLLFYGSTGLGKTFLLNCIAKELLDLGYIVIYQTAHNLLGVIEEYKFNKTDNIQEAKKKYEMLIEADLLIIDDLGSEASNSFTNSEIFNILNTRNLQGKKMLISTNLNPGEIASTYTDRIYSRLLDSFNIYRFFGKDLRWSK